MQYTELTTPIKDCLVFTPVVHKDRRGIFTEIYKFSSCNNFTTKQTNCSISKKGTLRGIHRAPYGKLVTCVKGEIYDVCVDLRPDSQTYNQYFSIYLNNINFQSLYIPPYCGHAFFSIKNSIIIYNQGEEYNASKDETYCYCDYNITWPFEPLHISDKDHNVCK